MSRELLVSRTGGSCWAAVRHAGKTVELHLESAAQPARVGRIYKARVSHVLAAIQSAFLDIGEGRSAFIHNSDLRLEGDALRPRRTAGRHVAGPGVLPIEQRLKAGRELVVQIVRESAGAKGDRASSLISIPGRYLVLAQGVAEHGVSRRIPDPQERARLTRILEALPAGAAVLVARTVAAGTDAGLLADEARTLLLRLERIREAAAITAAPRLLDQEPDLPLRLLRDAPPGGYERVVFDREQDCERARSYVGRFDAPAAGRIELQHSPRGLLEDEGLLREFEKATSPAVWLPSGGSLVIDETEALVSIDVNTSRSVRGNDPDRTIVETNLEAVQEIGRQLRLRNLGGIIVIDFIDMQVEQHRVQVVEALERTLWDDPARTKIAGLSELGLLELTRKRAREGLREQLTQPCPCCFARGRTRRPQLVALRLLAELRRRAADGGGWIVNCHPAAADELRRAIGCEAEAGLLPGVLSVEVRPDPSIGPEQFDVERA